jgi:aspartate kinase
LAIVSKIKIGGIIQNTNLVRISLTCVAGNPTAKSDSAAYAVLLESLGNAHISVDFIVHGSHQDQDELLIFCVRKDDWDNTQRIIQNFQANHDITNITADLNVTSIGIYGPDFRIKPGLAGALIKTIHSAGVTIQSISTSLSTFTMIVPADQADRALAAIHQEFELP